MECPQVHPDPCDNGREMVLKYRRSDRSPFYVCDCKPAHFRNPEKDWTVPSGAGAQRTGATAKAPAQFCCAECGAMNDVELVSFAIKKQEDAPQADNNAYPRGLRLEAQEPKPKPQTQTQSRGGYNRY